MSPKASPPPALAESHVCCTLASPIVRATAATESRGRSVG
jgi:hypothetical protein